MNKIEKKNTTILVNSSAITKFGDILFDYANNTFLASLNLNSMMLVGIYQTLENIVGIIFNLFGGVFADQFQRKKILILTDFLCGFSCIFLALISVNSWLIYAIIGIDVLLSMLSSFSTPAYKAITKEVVKKENIAKINSNIQTVTMIAKIVTPIIAINIYKVIGIHGVMILDGVTFILAGGIIWFISPIIGETINKETFSFRDIFINLGSGFKYLFKRKRILILIILSALVNFFLAGYELLLPYSNQMFPLIHGNIYGSFLLAQAIGGVFGAFLSGRINKTLSVTVLMFFLGMSGLLLSIAPFLYNISPNIIILSLSPSIYSLFLTMFNVQFFSIIQKEIESRYLGRIFGIIFTVALSFMPIGTMVFTMILTTSFTYNLLFIGLSVVVLAIIFNALYHIESRKLL